MNFNWVSEYKNGGHSSWSDADFKKYGLSESELAYAWIFPHICKSTLDWINEILSTREDDDFGIQETWLYIESDTIRIEDLCFEERKYKCSLIGFKNDLKFWSKNGL